MTIKGIDVSTWQDFKLISLINWYSFVNGVVYMVRIVTK